MPCSGHKAVDSVVSTKNLNLYLDSFVKLPRSMMRYTVKNQTIFKITQDSLMKNGPRSTVKTGTHGIPSQEKPKPSY